MPRDMSWLSPKRRRTTGNLRAVNGTLATNGFSEGITEEMEVPSPGGRRSSVSNGPTTPITSRPTLRPGFLSSSTSALPNDHGDGNLFYAYAQKADDQRSRFLLTFASASVANEWWLLVQAHFSECTRPGPQLFSFKTDDLLGKAWKHADFAHLKSKWMYIQFNDAGNVGGAPQGIIPVQDAKGHLLGGAAGSPEAQLGQVRKETRSVRNELGVLENHFERMMEAVEKNTEQVAALAAGRRENDAAIVQAVKDNSTHAHARNGADGHDEPSELSGHLGRIGDLLARNQEYVETLSRRQYESEQKLRETLEESKTHKRADYLDMSQLSSHLDRIQQMMETQARERKGSAKGLNDGSSNVDFSPVTEHLEKVLGAVEGNSALMRKMLEARSEDDTVVKVSEAAHIDLGPLTSHLEKIHGAIEQQSSHTLALQDLTKQNQRDAGVDQSRSLGTEHLKKILRAIETSNTHVKGLATQSQSSPSASALSFDTSSLKQKLGEYIEKLDQVSKGAWRNDLTPLSTKLDTLIELQQHSKDHSPVQIDLSPLTQRLDDLLDAQHSVTSKQQKATTAMSLRFDKLIDGQQKAVDRGPFDIGLLSQRLDEILSMHRDAATDALSAKVDQLIEAQPQATEQYDSSPVLEKLDCLIAEMTKLRLSMDMKPLLGRLTSMHATSKKSADSIDRLAKIQQDPSHDSKHSNADLAPLSGHIGDLHNATVQNGAALNKLLELHTPQNKRPVTPPSDFSPLVEHLTALHSATKDNGAQLAAFVKAQSADQKAVVPACSAVDFTTLAERLSHIHNSLERQAEAARSGSPSGTGQAKFIMSALSSHLSKIQAVTEANASAVHSLRETHLARESEMHVYISTTNDQIRMLREAQKTAQMPVLQAVARTTEDVRSLAQHLRGVNKTITDSRAASTTELKALGERSKTFEGVRDGQVNQVLRAQTEMVDSVRELAKALKEEKKECGHVVIPPPRKTGRKVVGFVYEGRPERGGGK
ncbi:hypothetical protein LTR95_005732 [Oleoguttula sp. CCFEE 5521]